MTKRPLKININILILIFVFVILSVYFSYISILKYRNYLTTSYDLAIYCQSIWGLINNWYFNTVRDIHTFAHHIQPVLYLLAIPYYLTNYSPETLLFIQTVIVSMSVFVLFYILRKYKCSNLDSILLSFMFFLYPPLQNTLFFEFHPGTLGIPFVFILLYNLTLTEKAFRLKNKVILSVAILFLLCCRENYALIIIPALLFYYIRTKNIFLLVLFAFVLIWFLGVIFYIKPLYNNDSSDLHLKYYYQFGNTYPQILQNLFLNPRMFIKYIYSWHKIKYLLLLFAPLLFIPLFQIRYLVFIIPILLVNLLSNHPGTSSIEYHFNNEILAIIYFSFIYSVINTKIYNNKIIDTIKINKLLLILVCISLLMFSYYYGKLPVSKKFSIMDLKNFTQRRKIFKKFKNKISKNEGVATEIYAVAHFANRRYVYIYPYLKKGVKWIIYDSYLDNYIKKSKNTLKVRKNYYNFILKNRYFSIIEDNNQYILLKRN